MIELKFDIAEFERKVVDLDAAFDQLPYAMSRSLNDAADETRRRLIDETWPSHITVRSTNFISYALRIDYSRKEDLRVAIYDQTNGRTHLKLHDEGGTKQARGRFIIPTGAVTLTAHGVRNDQRPANLKRKVVKGNAIYQEQGRGRRKRLVKMFTLSPLVRQPADVPFSEDFADSMSRSLNEHFTERMLEAMATRR